MSPLQIQELNQTCEACPSQWEGTLTDGRMVYVRYRWGYLSIRVSAEPTTDIRDAVRGEELFGAQVGDGMDGHMLYQQLRTMFPGLVEWPA